MIERYKITVEGVVQGVGFRPFVYKAASELGLFGWVLNDSRGVFIDIEGKKEQLEAFLSYLKEKTPPNAIIDSLYYEKSQRVLGRSDFIIKESVLEGTNCSMLPSDKAICPECLHEIKDPANRRYRYAFTNCVNCGPRYTIINKLPYDRARTSMAKFTMCPKCQKEYDDPNNRRYHAQPNSCSDCGPKLTLHRNNGTVLAENYKAIEAAAKLLKKGHILAIKGVGGFHLVCDATKTFLVHKLREKKKRPAKPFAVMFRHLSDIAKCTELCPLEEELILSSERPIVLLTKRKPHRLEKFCISCDGIAPGLNTMGVFLPYSPIHVLLFELVKFPLIVTSANISGEPLITDMEEMQGRLGDVYDYILDYDREIVNPVDDSVVTVQDGRAQMVRRGRGYAPINIKLPFKLKRNVLALGARQKNSIAIAFEDNCILSPFIGDLDTIRTQEYFKKTIETFLGFYNFTPDVIVLDKHPAYEYRQWAESSALPLVEVQHHHAHLLSLATEREQFGEFLGIVWDGTGYGDDGTIWGGEFFLCSDGKYTRVAHFKEFLLLGGDKAAQEPKRSAFSILYAIYGERFFELEIPLLKEFSKEEKETFKKMHDSKLNSFSTTSVGRIFDAVAALCQGVYCASYEGESGMRIEAAVEEKCNESYEYEINAEGIIDLGKMFTGIIEEEEPERVAAKFINTLVQIIVTVAKRFNRKVLLSGGVFQNRALCAKVIQAFKQEGIEYYMHETVPPNDGGIALGQVAYAYYAEGNE